MKLILSKLHVSCVLRKTVRDKQTGQDVVLSDKDVELIHRLESSKIPDSAFNEYAVIFIFLIFLRSRKFHLQIVLLISALGRLVYQRSNANAT